jgi:hypothetical protein
MIELLPSAACAGVQQSSFGACLFSKPTKEGVHSVCGSFGAVAAAIFVSNTQLAMHADGLLTRSPLPLQGPFPETFPLLPDLVILEMDHNRFKCAPCFCLLLASSLRTV